jgi:hypothetical protein
MARAGLVLNLMFVVLRATPRHLLVGAVFGP